MRVLNSNDVNLLQQAFDALVDWENTYHIPLFRVQKYQHA